MKAQGPKSEGSYPPRILGFLERAGSRQLIAILGAFFCLVHVLYYLAGVRFDSSPLDNYLQYLDPQLLRDDLWQSLFYLHIQPPLFNLFLGLVLKLSLGMERSVFHLAYLAMGFVFYLAIFYLLVRMSVDRLTSLALSTLYMASPTFILYENYLFYTFPVGMLFAVSALFFHRTLGSKEFRPALTFFFVLFIIGGVRSMFHLAYFLTVVAGAVWLRRDSRRQVVAAAVIPGVLLGSFYLKNYVLFDKFTVNTWVGMNFCVMTSKALPAAERMKLIREGKISPLVAIRRFAPLDAYPASYRQVQGFEGIPALRQERKTEGASNFNHLAYIPIYDQYMSDAVYALKHYPGVYLGSVFTSWANYLKSGSDYSKLKPNRDRIERINWLYDHLFYGQLPFDLARSRLFGALIFPRPNYPCVFLIIGLPFLFGWGLWLAYRSWPADNIRLDQAQKGLLLYLLFNIVFVALTGNLIEKFENNRFRFATEPFYLCLLGLFLTHQLYPFLRARLPAPQDRTGLQEERQKEIVPARVDRRQCPGSPENRQPRSRGTGAYPTRGRETIFSAFRDKRGCGS